MTMIFNSSLLLILCLCISVQAVICGRYSDNCNTLPGQDLDYVLMVGNSGDVENIEYRYLIPTDDSCGEEHLNGLIWEYTAKPIAGIQDSYNSTVVDIYFVTWNLESSKSYHCNKDLVIGQRYSIVAKKEIECFVNQTVNPWKEYDKIVGKQYTLNFKLDNDILYVSRNKFYHISQEGCPIPIDSISLVAICVSVAIVLVIIVALAIYYYYYKKSVKTIAGDKVKLFKKPVKAVRL